MTFSKFIIKNFKCFKDEKSFIFAQPKDLIGSGITYIVGANNSGKTTIIEALSKKDGDKIKSSERTQAADLEFILYEDSVVKNNCKLIRSESYTIKEDPKLRNEERFEIISSRRHWESNANSKFTNIGDSLINSFSFQKRQNSIDVGSELKGIEENTDKYDAFIDLVKRVIPEFTKFAVAYEDNEYIEYISGSGIRHKSDFLGDGVIAVIRILLHLFVEKSNPLIIDEPELSLHPTAQKKLLKIIAEYSKNRQIIIATHSPYFVDWEYLKNGAVINRVVKFQDKDSDIFSIYNFDKYIKLIKSANWQQPYLLDVVAKEIFFTPDNILFLEGQEDVGLLRDEKELEDINIFGYGVRGKNNFEFALELAKDLGFKKVSCVLDNGESEKGIKKVLEEKFTQYKIVQWNKNDIRDKEKHISEEKDGYFNKKGDKKDETLLDDFYDKMKEIKEYIKNEGDI